MGSPRNLMVLLLLLLASIAHAQGAKPPLASQSAIGMKFEWTVQQREDGKLSAGLHQWQLFCRAGRCEAEGVSLNQCMGDRFWPKVERFSAEGGTLTVRDDGRTLVAEAKTGEATMTHRISYRFEGKTPKPVSYSGAYLKDSLLLGRVIVVEYVPLKPDANHPSEATRKLDCMVALPTIAAQER